LFARFPIWAHPLEKREYPHFHALPPPISVGTSGHPDSVRRNYKITERIGIMNRRELIKNGVVLAGGACATKLLGQNTNPNYFCTDSVTNRKGLGVSPACSTGPSCADAGMMGKWPNCYYPQYQRMNTSLVADYNAWARLMRSGRPSGTDQSTNPIGTSWSACISRSHRISHTLRRRLPSACASSLWREATFLPSQILSGQLHRPRPR
jgi:hypothetical protein